ncbi:MAG TPA: hypothetical protein VNZ57_11770, partial [Longimicrobiales bacterium]|nr:hypothetical protein [Longimicrobiales bacterium]
MSSQVLELRQEIAERFPGAVPVGYRTTPVVATGVEPLDRVLPGGGLPRGRLVAWVPGGGATAVLRGVCVDLVRRGERAAWVDGTGRVVGETWPEGPLLVRPRDEAGALVCAEELLRSGGFGLVVLAGASLDSAGVRLSRRAREGGAAFVALVDAVPVAALRMVSRIPVDGYRWRLNPFGEPTEVEAVRVEVRVAGLGLSTSTRFWLGVAGYERRLSMESWLVDRRGVVATR